MSEPATKPSSGCVFADFNVAPPDGRCVMPGGNARDVRLLEAERDGLASLLLDVQRDCIAALKALEECNRARIDTQIALGEECEKRQQAEAILFALAAEVDPPLDENGVWSGGIVDAVRALLLERDSARDLAEQLEAQMKQGTAGGKYG